MVKNVFSFYLLCFFLFLKSLLTEISERRKLKIKIKIFSILRGIISVIVFVIIKFKKLLEIIWLFTLIAFFFDFCNGTLKLKT